MNEEPRVPLIRDLLTFIPVGLAAGVVSGVINGMLSDDLTMGGGAPPHAHFRDDFRRSLRVRVQPLAAKETPQIASAEILFP